MQTKALPDTTPLTPPDALASVHEFATRSGFRTSEFALIASLTAAGLLLALGHVLNGEIAFACSSAAAVIFANIRANYKSAAVASLIQAMQGASVSLHPSTLRGVEAAAGEIARAALPAVLQPAGEQPSNTSAAPVSLTK